ncbi:MAG: hypothetical protein HYR51_12685 [Candidatus Rokubacteria bacterium]|nr:hypothetical protein [Candidatus Rokubacteria bacterium]
MESRDVRSYVERGWAAAETGKREHWAHEFATRGPQSTLDAAHTLWVHMRAVRPDWPTERERDADLAHHIALKRAIDRAAGFFLASR